MRFPSHRIVARRHARPLVRPLAIAAVFTASAAFGLTPSAHAATKPALDIAALGSGGGAFCDGTRKQLIDTLKSDITSAMLSGDTAKVKAYYENLMAQTTKLIALAPASIRPSLVLTTKRSEAMGAALKKAGYDFSKLDPAALSAKPDAATAAAQVKVDAYLLNTCHMDVAKAMGIPTAVLTPTTKPTATTKKK